jgi:ATP-dependent 26S proteasome regulatory subunit
VFVCWTTATDRAVVFAVRDGVKTAKKEYDKTEDDLKALQSVGQIIGEVLKQLDEERCKSIVQTVEAIGSVRHFSQMSRKFAGFCAAVFWRSPQVAVQFFADFG